MTKKDADDDHLKGLNFLESLLMQRPKRSSPLKQLKIYFRIKSLNKQIENAEEILKDSIWLIVDS